MLTLDCATLTIPVRLDHCVEPITRASLNRRNQEAIELTPSVDPTDDHRLLLALPANAKLMRGIWRLALETDCRCYDAPVFVDVCQPPAFEGVYTPTGDQGPAVVCCAPTLQPLWNGTHVVLGFIAGESNGLVGLDSDLSLGTLLSPAPAYDDLAFVTAVDGIGGVTFSGTLSPVRAGYTQWRLYDAAGVELMSGTISGTSLVLGTAAVALTCKTYYVRFLP